MSELVKFVSVTRVIDQKSGVHYLDAVDNKGQHWMAEMSHSVEKWQVFTRTWFRDVQQPGY